MENAAAIGFFGRCCSHGEHRKVIETSNQIDFYQMFASVDITEAGPIRMLSETGSKMCPGGVRTDSAAFVCRTCMRCAVSRTLSEYVALGKTHYILSINWKI